MSRSYRKAYLVDGYGNKWKKKIKNAANRKVRLSEDIADGKQYRKLYESYDICDWKFKADDSESFPLWKVRRK
jgi:hypothetical protein